MKKADNGDRKNIQYEECKTVDTPSAGDDGLESALEAIGGYNRWMWMVFIMASVPGIFNIWALTSYVFLGVELEHWCIIPQLKKQNWTDSQIRKIVTGSETGSSCTAPSFNYEQLSRMPFEDAVKYAKIQQPQVKTIDCIHGFDYEDYGTSVVSEWDLVCDRLFLRSTVQMVVALGKFIGALSFGFVADRWGRKLSFVISCVMYIVAGPLAALIPNYWVFLFCRLILGMAGSGCYNCAFTLLTEVANSKIRTLMGILYNMSYPVGMVLLPLVAYYVPNWKHLQLALSVPALVLIINCWLIPESPRWLLSKNRRADVWKIIHSANKIIGTNVSSEMNMFHAADRKEQEQTKETVEIVQKESKSTMQEMMSLVCNCELLSRLLICHYTWCITALTYFALSLNADNFTADRYIYIAVSGAVEAVSYILPIPILRWVGRRPTSAAMYLLCGLALLCIMAIPLEYTVAIMTVAMIGRLCNSAVYSVIVLYTSELFPTANRNMAVGTSSTMSHVGSIVAPYIVDLLGAAYWYVPSTICALCSLLAGMLVLLLPETKGKELCDTVEETESRAQQGESVSLRNCCSCH